jgi:hypothetical protein
LALKEFERGVVYSTGFKVVLYGLRARSSRRDLALQTECGARVAHLPLAWVADPCDYGRRSRVQ